MGPREPWILVLFLGITVGQWLTHRWEQGTVAGCGQGGWPRTPASRLGAEASCFGLARSVEKWPILVARVQEAATSGKLHPSC